jgi:hypothetical protein
MAETYALLVQIESHEYYGEFYLVGKGYGTPAEVLEYVAGDHLLRMSDAPRIEEYLLDVLNEGKTRARTNTTRRTPMSNAGSMAM